MTLSPEETLKALDQRGAKAVLENDAPALARIYADHLVLHFAPAKLVRTGEQVLSDMRTNPTLYDSFVRTTEFVSIQGDIGITIGREAAVPTATHPAHTSGPIQRRYSHVWRKEKDDWKLLFRHVSMAE